MIVVTIGDIVGIILSILIIVSIAIYLIKEKIEERNKVNCFECKNYELDDVASFGDRCWYRCNKKNTRQGHSMNDNKFLVFCEEFERENKGKKEEKE